MSTLSTQILSDIVVFNKYAKYLPIKKRRETYLEIATRNRDMHIRKFESIPGMKQEITQVWKDFVLTKKVLPSMRAFQFAGKPIELSPNRIYNCSAAAIDHPDVFSEIMFLLLGGSGVGYSVQKNHVEKLPPVRKPIRRRRYLVGDSIEGWADAVKILLKAYFYSKSMPNFDFSDIREKGAPLITSGGKAPGPEPLRVCLHQIKMILDSKKDGEQLSPLECHDIVCHIADAVLSGGIRRAACISLFDIDDHDMLTCKFGDWWERNPQRSRANNSAVVLRHKFKKKDFKKLWDKIKASGSGEPGIYLTNNSDYLTNPCAEISLKSNSFCNLTEINMSDVTSQKDLNERCKAASFIGTLQVSYTDFHYLRDIWKHNTEKDALLGVSGTGLASGAILNCNMSEAAKIAVEENIRVANLIKVNPASRVTTIKPGGTTSLVLGTSSGCHAWFDRWYIRRLRTGKNEALYKYLAKEHPELVEDEYFKPHSDAVISIPIEAPANAVYSTQETPLELLERIKTYHEEWIKPGHIKGDNTHNVSATIYIRDEEWEDVAEWMWKNRDSYNGLSVFPRNEKAYIQAPHESISRQKYTSMISNLKAIDLTKVKEVEDNTDLAGEIACAGGQCSLK